MPSPSRPPNLLIAAALAPLVLIPLAIAIDARRDEEVMPWTLLLLLAALLPAAAALIWRQRGAQPAGGLAPAGQLGLVVLMALNGWTCACCVAWSLGASNVGELTPLLVGIGVALIALPLSGARRPGALPYNVLRRFTLATAAAAAALLTSAALLAFYVAPTLGGAVAGATFAALTPLLLTLARLDHAKPREAASLRLGPELTLDPGAASAGDLPALVLPNQRYELRAEDTLSLRPPPGTAAGWIFTRQRPGQPEVKASAPIPDHQLAAVALTLQHLQARSSCALHTPWGRWTPDAPPSLQAALGFLDGAAEALEPPSSLRRDSADPQQEIVWSLPRHAELSAQDNTARSRLQAAALAGLLTAPLALLLWRWRPSPNLTVRLTADALHIDGQRFLLTELRALSVLPVTQGPPVVLDATRAVTLPGLDRYDERTRFGRHLLTRVRERLDPEHAARPHPALTPLEPPPDPAPPRATAARVIGALGAACVALGAAALTYHWRIGWTLHAQLTEMPWPLRAFGQSSTWTPALRGYPYIALAVALLGGLLLALASTPTRQEAARRAALALTATLALLLSTALPGWLWSQAAPASLSGQLVGPYDLDTPQAPSLDLRGARVTGLWFGFGSRIDHLQLDDATLDRTGFNAARLPGASLQRAKLRNINLHDVQLEGANLQDADLSLSDFYEVNLQRANLQRADLTFCYLHAVNLDHADLQGADLSDSRTSPSAERTTLRHARLQRARLHRTELYLVDLTGADLQGADLTGANLTDADLTGANLTGANLTDVRWKGATCPDGHKSQGEPCEAR